MNTVRGLRGRLSGSRVRAWVTYSPQRLRGTVVAVLAVLTVAGFAVAVRAVVFYQDTTYRQAQATYEQAVKDANEANATPTPAVTPTTTPTEAGGLPPAPDPTAEATAVRFVNLWLAGRTAKSQAAWMDTLTPVVAPDELAKYRTVTRSLIPAAKVKKVASTYLIDGKAYTTIHLTGGTLVLVTLTGSPENWAVAGFTDVQED